MHESPHAQAAGSFLIALFAFVLHRTAHINRPVTVYRQALELVAAYLAMVAIVRMVILAGWLTQEEARVINGLLAGVYAVTLIALLSVTAHCTRAATRRPMPVPQPPRFPLDDTHQGGAQAA